MKHYLLFFAFVSLISGCAHQPIPREASEYLLTTDRDAEILIKAIRKAFEDKKYTIIREDVSAGLLVLAPRRFTFNHKGLKTDARQFISLRQEGGSLKIRITYDCNYSGDKTTFVSCDSHDVDVASKITRIEGVVIENVKPHLMKTKEDAPETKTVE